MSKVAFIGLGVMGYPMAGHLQAAGHSVTVYNRTVSTAVAWVAAHGGRQAATPAAAATGADYVMTCVGNDDDLRTVVLGEQGVLAGMSAGSVLIDHTTASAAVARELAAVAAERGVAFIDAPVSGGQQGAQNGALTIMCGGEADAFERAAAVMKAYAKATTHLGPVGAGQLTKMVNQICVAGVVQGLAEGMNFAARAGLDVQKVIDAISGRRQQLADDESAQDHDRRRIRARLCHRLDAQGPRHRPRRGRQQRRRPDGDGADQ